MSYSIFKHDGLALRLWDSGGEGLPVIFQHGLCGDSNQTRDVFPASERFRLITLECRGHGESEAGDCSAFSIATFADDIQAMAQSLALQRYVIGGISMGAAIALRAAKLRPREVAGLVLARPAWATQSAPVNMRPNALAGILIAEFGATRGLEIFRESTTAKHLQDAAPNNLNSLLGFFARKPEAVTAELLQRIAMDGPGVSAKDCSTLAFPTLVIGHDRDYVHPLAMALELARFLPNAALREVTPKSDNKAQYITDFKTAFANFLEGIT